MSDSGDDVVLPSDSAIEDALREVVRAAIADDAELTINAARTQAEEELGLDEGFFKNNSEWKERSKNVIQATFEEPASPETAKKPAAKPTAGTKRKSDDGGQDKKKRRKKSPVIDQEPDEDIEAEQSAPEAEPEAKPKAKSADTSALSSPPDTEDEPALLKSNGKAAPVAANVDDDDDSDLSSLIDDPPPKKKRQSKSSTSSTKPSKPTKSPSKSTTKSSTKPTKPTKELSPDEEEIKRLQSWLLKCGIRKLWHRELAPYSSAKEKIKHLKGMLDEVGMTGRFSTEKAARIKEERELKAELEAAREFNEQWGHEKDEDGDGDGNVDGEGVEKGRGRLKPRGLIDFGDDSGDES